MALEVRIYSEYDMHCDSCGWWECGHSNGEFLDLNDFKKQYREMGWSIGKRVLCPDCSGKTPTYVPTGY